MNSKNSFLVKYHLIELKNDFGVYKKGNVWAEPDIDDAAFLMKFIFKNPEFAKKVGELGSEYIKTNFSSKTSGNEIISHIKSQIS